MAPASVQSKFIGSSAAVQFLAISAGPIIMTLPEIFPAEIRATAMGLVYALGVAIFGGFGQFIVTWLIAWTGSPMAPIYYVMVCSAITLLSQWGVPETKGRALA